MRLLAFILFLLFENLSFSQQWKDMANDPNINLYDVVAEAESYFLNVDKTRKGSGWKAYQRWLHENEPKYYPSGNRNNIESSFVSKEFKEFVSKNSDSNKKIFDNGWEELGPYYIEEVTGHYAVGFHFCDAFFDCLI